VRVDREWDEFVSLAAQTRNFVISSEDGDLALEAIICAHLSRRRRSSDCSLIHDEDGTVFRRHRDRPVTTGMQ
jgi:hypothetical protein